ncbi:MAG: histidine phosphatase family protein [Candidatus Dormibacter sp.]|uniref:histidine phosphatase family protein n=1 Tax=Candidatus Dormibacter sp. TaxID=2973982 RepID=UPI000DB2666B|nr:MAG: histidine phosphatase family protein [Candidatus Dormibacteraeota bacterium]
MQRDIYLARHGATEWSESGQHTSFTDLPLLSLGETEARRLGAALREHDFTAVFASDRQRALQTAELAGFGAVTVSPLLREFDYGRYEGLTTPEIREQAPGWELFRDGCPKGETPAQVGARARLALRLLEEAAGDVLVFSHGHFARALAVAWADLEIESAARFGLDSAAYCVLRLDPHGRTIHRWNVHCG